MLKMAKMKYWKITFVIIAMLCVFSIIVSVYFLHGRDNSSALAYKSNFEAYFAGRFLQRKFADNELNKDYSLNLEKEDVIVFLHIQKTGGTAFGKHLVENLDVDSPCNCYKRVRKHCDCLTKKKQVWLFSRYSTGWECGLHADWTELTTCVDGWFQSNYGTKKRRSYHYITLLRDPVARFISEWMHVRRGATWKAAALRCNGRQATLEEVPFCFTSKNWRGVSLDDFMTCKHNLALNRQTRMLANLSEVHCYSAWSAQPPPPSPPLGRRMLDSAKRNLLNMAFFGLLEFQTYTQFLFQHTLNIGFLRDFRQESHTHSGTLQLGAKDLERIAELNPLDVELYHFAKDLFLQRVRRAYLEENLPLPQHLIQELAALQGSGKAGGNDPTPPSVPEGGAASQESVLTSQEEDDDASLHHKRFISRNSADTKRS